MIYTFDKHHRPHHQHHNIMNEKTMLLWEEKLDSIAVSVFVVFLVEMDNSETSMLVFRKTISHREKIHLMCVCNKYQISGRNKQLTQHLFLNGMGKRSLGWLDWDASCTLLMASSFVFIWAFLFWLRLFSFHFYISLNLHFHSFHFYFHLWVKGPWVN